MTQHELTRIFISRINLISTSSTKQNNLSSNELNKAKDLITSLITLCGGYLKSIFNRKERKEIAERAKKPL
jgi:hypothetical protein